MSRRFNAADPGFLDSFDRFLGEKRDHDSDVSQAAAAILKDVRTRGDAAVLDYTSRFDKTDLTPQTMAVGADEIEAAREACDPELLEALAFAAKRIEDFHKRQLPKDDRFTDALGVELGARWHAVDAVGLYVPGGKAAYPSSLLMNAVPARVAGVERIAMCVPTPGGVINPIILAAAHTAGITEIYRIGGAQAIGALAYGTDTIARVDQIVGPGNAYVNAAKRLVFGTVGIDLLAGPSEILVVADRENDPAWIAIDLLSQAEHDEAARSVLITDAPDFADAVEKAVDSHLATLDRAAIARASWESHGGIVLVPSLEAAVPIVNRIAPEHLELAIADPDGILPGIKHAGAIFLGRHTPEAVGDYVAGTNHVLPTGGSARFSSGLSVLDFMKRSSIVRCTPDSLAALGGSTVRLAEAEGLGAHARSVSVRLNRT